MMPCKKCISYAICKPKRVIYCDMLDSYADVLLDKYMQGYVDENSNTDFWSHLREVLPHLVSVISESGNRSKELFIK